MKPRIDRLREFYDAVDAGDVEAAISVFHEKILYQRGSRTFATIGEVRRFYETGRSKTISGGSHAFTKVHEEDDTVVVVGSFDGRYADGSAGIVEFVDAFTFDGDKVSRRVTTFPGREI